MGRPEATISDTYLVGRELMGDCHDHDMYDGDPNDGWQHEGIECNRCGEDGLFWDRVNGDWILKDEETLQRHVCETDFDDIPEPGQ